MARKEEATMELIHERELMLFDAFAKICNRHNLKYYAIQGSTLGVIFWKGFIPWDDDMDLAMPIKDYLEFLKIVGNELPNNMLYIESKYSGGKIVDTESTFIEATLTCTPVKWHGVFIDIVPLIALPNNKKKRRQFCQDMRQYHLEAIKYEKYPESCTLSSSELDEWRERLVNSENYDSAKFVTDFSFGYYYKFKAKGFTKPIKGEFCGRELYISSTYDYDLKSRYGVYKKYPKDNMKYAHNKYALVDLTRSYRDYANEYNNAPEWIKDLIKKERNLEGEYYSSFQWLKEQNENLQDRIKSDEKNLSLMVSRNSWDYKIGNKILYFPRFIKNKIKGNK